MRVNHHKAFKKLKLICCVLDVFALLSLVLLAAALTLLFYALRPRTKVDRLARGSARQQVAAVHAVKAERRGAEARLGEVLDLVSDAIHLLERYARDNPEEARELDEAISALEDVEETLDRLVRKRKSAGQQEGTLLSFLREPH